MANKCKACGKAIRTQYVYCFNCLERNRNMVWDQPDAVKCRVCGITIGDRYIYCYSCAKKKKLVD